ncbi:MAG: sulfotransferase [Rhodobacteraceae bacterium]|nr:sulfotransferase [Paracoccaceae bacterium]
MEYVFIVGLPRTGSKIYMSIINDFSDIDIVREMHYLAPRFIRKSAVSSLQLEQQPLNSPERVGRAIERMYDGQLSGAFWEKRSKEDGVQLRLVDIEKNALQEALLNSSGTPRDLFRIILQKHAESVGKKRAGAKFPVDIGCVPRILEWCDNAKIIHIVRDPRAIYTSMVMRERPGSGKPGIPRGLAASKRLPYIIMQYRKAASLHSRFNVNDNYIISRFEDVTEFPEESLRKIAGFLGFKYTDEMKSQNRVDSSYSYLNKKGIDSGAATQWESHILAPERKIIEIILKKEMRMFGYV